MVAHLSRLAYVRKSKWRPELFQLLNMRSTSDNASSDSPLPGERAVGLSPAQMGKAILAGNCRAQLTTIIPQSPPQGCGSSPEVTSTVVHYLSARGSHPVVLLGQGAQHAANLASLPQASLCTGHLSPPTLVQRIRAAGWLPHRVNMVGHLRRLPHAEVKFAWEQARSQFATSLLGEMLPSESALGGMEGYCMEEVDRCQFVDATGKQHEVPPHELDAAYLDPLALGQVDLLTEFLEDPDRRLQLRTFCAAYLGVEVQDAVVTEIDRMGFTVLGRPLLAESEEQQQQRWRQFRFGFQREMKDKNTFITMVEDMWKEVQAQAAEKQQQ